MNCSSKPELLVVGPTYAISFNRRKLTALTAFFSVTCATSELHEQKLYGRSIHDFEESKLNEPFALRRFKEWPRNQKFTRLMYSGLVRLFREKQFDFVLVDSEPWGVLKWQTWVLTRRYQSSALFGEFSWENLLRPGLKGILLALVYRAAAKADNFTISGNSACRSLLVKFGARADRNLVAAQLGVETNLFRPVSSNQKQLRREELSLPAGVFVIGFCGRLVPEKGIRELYEAVRRLRESDEQIHLAFLGDGPIAQSLSHLREPWCHLFASRPHFEIPAFMQSLDLFVLPSKPLRQRTRVWEEQFGHVLIEAMACGIPSLGSNSGAIPEVLGDPEAVFAHSDVDALFARLRFFRESRSERELLAERQFRRVCELYSHRAVARIYADFLLSLPRKRKVAK